MPALTIKETIHIDAPIEQVYHSLKDFRQWQAWSPWLIAEPDCKVTHAEDGMSYAWEGDIVGSGNMAINGGAEPTSIFYQLTFLKPWKSFADVRFKLEDADGSTRVSWEMDSALPFFMFWKKSKVQAMIAMDYKRGLTMLKDHLETGSVPSELRFSGQEHVPGCQYLGLRTTCAIKDIGKRMEDDFSRLRKWIAEHEITPAGPLFSIYHKWELAKGITTYTAAIPVEKLPNRLGDSLVAGQREGTDVYQITHTGPYRHIGNAWASGMMHSQAKQFKLNKKIHPFEIYANHPGEVAEHELITQVNVPRK